MDFPGIEQIDDSASTCTKFEHWSTDDRPTAVRITGGVGDALIVAQVALSAEKPVHMYVQGNQVSLIEMLMGKGNVFPSQYLNSPSIQRRYGGIFNCLRLFANSHEIKNNDYYDTVQQYLGVSNVLIQPLVVDKFVSNHACIHAGSSNPNRRISPEAWTAVAKSLISAGHTVLWLGTVGDFGIHSPPHSYCTWYNHPTLPEQVKLVANAKHFYGNDSGFCHIAGIQRVPGDVLFTNTCAEHVLSQYPTLTGHTPPNITLSRSLKVDDLAAVQALAHWTPSNVLSELGLNSHDMELPLTTPEPLLLFTQRIPWDYDELVDQLEARGVKVQLGAGPGVPHVTFEDTHILLTWQDSSYSISRQCDEFIRALHEIGLA